MRVTFRMKTTGGGVSGATLGVVANVKGAADNPPTVLCAPEGDVPACRDGSTFEASFVFEIGATVEYVWYQDLGPDDIFFQRNTFVVSPMITTRSVSYDVQA